MTATDRTDSQGRLHDLDAMRSVLMLLGVVIHSANPYRPQGTWLISDPDRSRFFSFVVDFLHQFRLPAFFVVAGYFLAMALERYRPGMAVADRGRRLLLPCVMTLVILNIPQELILAAGLPGARAEVGGLAARWNDGSLVGHLWFLINLFGYSVIAAFLVGPRLRVLFGSVPATGVGMAMLLGIGVAGDMAAAASARLGEEVASGYLLGLVNLPEFISYAPFVLAGMMLHRSPGLLAAFRSPGFGAAATAAAALAGSFLVGHYSGTTVASIARVACHAIMVWYLVRLCFWLFHRTASSPSRTFRYLSDASYSIYLFHHLVVVVIASALVGSGFPLVVKFTLVMLTATAVSLAIHHFIVLRYPLMSLLFNGKPMRRAPG